MITLTGKKASPGYAEGVLFVKKAPPEQIEHRKNFSIVSPEAEKEKYLDAVEECKTEFESLKRKAASSSDPSSAAIFDIHEMMITDDDFCAGVFSAIDSGLDAVLAVRRTAKSFAAMFSSMSGEYMKARAADVKDVSERLISIIDGSINSTLPSRRCILASGELSPSEAVSLDSSKVIGVVTENGSATSHSSILARSLGIPAVVGVGKIDPSLDGKYCILDGENAKVYVEPDEITKKNFASLFSSEKESAEALEKFRGKLSVTAEGKRIKVFANIGSVEDALLAADNDAEGIGLFRSEFLYMKSEAPPSEDEQFRAYREVGEKMKGRHITVRTLDAGADKCIPYINTDKELNPALGNRAIRVCLADRELFMTQLRALYRASAYADISIMFPMITTVDELIEAKRMCTRAQDELKASQIPFSAHTKIGIMIETPAAAICADSLARHADFFSIGTNDLVQYTMAADRENEKVAYLTEKLPEAVKRLIERTAKCAYEAGIEVGICGELASDTTLTDFFVSAGIKKLSVNPRNILRVRKAVSESGKSEKSSVFTQM